MLLMDAKDVLVQRSPFGLAEAGKLTVFAEDLILWPGAWNARVHWCTIV